MWLYAEGGMGQGWYESSVLEQFTKVHWWPRRVQTWKSTHFYPQDPSHNCVSTTHIYLRSFIKDIRYLSSLTWDVQIFVTWNGKSSVCACVQELPLKAPSLTGLETLGQERSGRNCSWTGWGAEGHSNLRMFERWNRPPAVGGHPVFLLDSFWEETVSPDFAQPGSRDWDWWFSLILKSRVWGPADLYFFSPQVWSQTRGFVSVTESTCSGGVSGGGLKNKKLAGSAGSRL